MGNPIGRRGASWVIAALACAGLLCAGRARAAADAGAAADASAAADAGAAAHADGGPGTEQARMLDLVNRERTTRRLRPLAWNATLARLASAHARDMSQAGRISHHSSQDGATFAQRAARSELRARAVAENVGVAPDLLAAHRGLMDSPGHRANILDVALDAVGIGLVRGADGRELYVAQDFAALLPDLTETEAGAALREALRHAAGARSLAEDAALSRRLAEGAARMARADSIKDNDIVATPPAWVFTFTSLDPRSLPQDLAQRAAAARSFALGVVFARSKSTPFGAWWVAVVLQEGSAQP